MSEADTRPPRLSRREFFANGLLTIAGLLGAATLGERFLAFLYPVVPPEQTVEVPVANRDAIPPGGGLIVHSPVGHIALEDVNGTVRAFSAVCTHLGCIVQWRPGPDSVWLCPCHQGRYDRTGRVVGGPPPRPLDALPVSVREGQVFVRLKVRIPPAPREGATT